MINKKFFSSSKIQSFASVSANDFNLFKGFDDFVTTYNTILDNFLENVTIVKKDSDSYISDDILYHSNALYLYFYTKLLIDYEFIITKNNLKPGINYEEIYIVFYKEQFDPTFSSETIKI